MPTPLSLVEFPIQNWLITPAALAFKQQPPANIHEQIWLVVLTGVVTANRKGKNQDWLNETVSFMPDMSGNPSGPEQGTSGPLGWAVDQYRIPKPPATAGKYRIKFSLEHTPGPGHPTPPQPGTRSPTGPTGWAPFVSLSSIFDQNESKNAGFAVNEWRISPFKKTEPPLGNDLLTHQPVGNIFTGVTADIAIRDSDAHILLLGYHITLLGRIVFPADGEVFPADGEVL
jgi:hypothetical protein